ncbi:MAG: hypothetical protein V2A34_09805 [Lentisphaerota bacterium]
MVINNICRCFPGTSLLLAAGILCCAMAPRPVPPPVPMEFVRAAYEPEAAAIAIEWVVPHVKAVGPLARLELLILDPKAEPVFGAMQVLGNDCDPVPSGAFGVILDPASEDRSIKNVTSAGQNGQWDQASRGGTLLRQSVSGVTGGNLGIAFWIAPKDWKPGRHVIQVRAVRKGSRPEPWRTLAAFDYSNAGVEAVVPNRGLVKPVFRIVGEDAPIPREHLAFVTLIRYERRKPAKGATKKS